MPAQAQFELDLNEYGWPDDTPVYMLDRDIVISLLTEMEEFLDEFPDTRVYPETPPEKRLSPPDDTVFP